MLSINTINLIIYIVLLSIIFVCILGILLSIRFQKKQKQKYQECIKIIKEKTKNSNNENNLINNKQIELMGSLYNNYIQFQNLVCGQNLGFTEFLTDEMKEYYIERVKLYENKQYREIINNFELLNYDIVNKTNDSIEFRINFKCINYIEKNNQIISGNNLKPVNRIILVHYKNINNKWLINRIEKAYEKYE